MVTVVDTTAVTWNMVIASDTDNDHPPNVTVPDVFDRVGTLTQGEDGFDDQCHLAVACRRLEGNLVRMVHGHEKWPHRLAGEGGDHTGTDRASAGKPRIAQPPMFRTSVPPGVSVT
jgi:hypothetical protein